MVDKLIQKHIKLGVNIDHVATVRNARGGIHPDPITAAERAIAAGADFITAHLREDRRHIRDEDIKRIMQEVQAPLNLEIAATTEMLAIALKTKPKNVCLVPEKRHEITTEGGLDVVAGKQHLCEFIQKLQDHGISVSLFINADKAQIDASIETGAKAIEFHTGAYCHTADMTAKTKEFLAIQEACAYADKLGLGCHAGHGLDYFHTKQIVSIPEITELNIGHFIIGEAIFDGIETVIRKMLKIIKLEEV